MGHTVTALTLNSFTTELKQRLDEIREQGLYRELRQIDSPQSPQIKIAGKDFLNFSSNDYLGLANHPRLNEAAIHAVECFGAGSGASRLICGSLAPHHELESALAEFKKAESALVFSSGYAAAIGAIGALAGKDDIIILDKLVHASIVDAARLSGAKLRVFAHNDLNELEDILRWAAQRAVGPANSRKPHALIVTESVFSMDGDTAPLREIVTLKNKYGAWLMVDEAHATGLFGKHRRGLIEDLSLSDQVEIQMGTLGKALGSSGGYICGPRELTDFLINRARSFIFSTAPVPAAAAAARAAVELVQSSEGEALAQKLWSLVDETKTSLAQTGWPVAANRAVAQASKPAVSPISKSAGHPHAENTTSLEVSATSTPIIPLHIGSEAEALETATALRQHGIFIPAIRYPTVARGHARLRLTLTAAHTSDDIAKLMAALPLPFCTPHSALRT
jgi:8-amino-7-oxononanoate synthase